MFPHHHKGRKAGLKEYEACLKSILESSLQFIRECLGKLGKMMNLWMDMTESPFTEEDSDEIASRLPLVEGDIYRLPCQRQRADDT